MQLLLQQTLSWLGAMPQPASTTCDAEVGPSVPDVAIYATYFACLPNPDGGMCLPAVGAALEASGLGAAARGDVPLDFASVDASVFCPAIGAAGCCAGSALQAYQGYLQMTCQTARATQLQGLLSACDGVPGQCPGFELPPAQAPPSCSDPVAGPPALCAFRAGECPQTPCELLCAATTLTQHT